MNIGVLILCGLFFHTIEVSSQNDLAISCFYHNRSVNNLNEKFVSCQAKLEPGCEIRKQGMEIKKFNNRNTSVDCFEFIGGNLNFIPRIDKIFPNLKVLILNNSNLTKVDKSDLDPFHSLISLDLAHNHITDLPEDVFSKLPLLKILDLSNNQISTLSEKIFANNPKIETIILLSNPLSEKETQWNFFHALNNCALDIQNGFRISLRRELIQRIIGPPQTKCEINRCEPSPSPERLQSNCSFLNSIDEKQILIIAMTFIGVIILQFVIIVAQCSKSYSTPKEKSFESNFERTDCTEIDFNDEFSCKDFENYETVGIDGDYEEIPVNKNGITSNYEEVNFNKFNDDLNLGDYEEINLNEMAEYAEVYKQKESFELPVYAEVDKSKKVNRNT